MKKLDKTLCDLTKTDLDKYDKELKKLIKNPKHFCKKCFRASSNKEFLCKPSKIK